MLVPITEVVLTGPARSVGALGPVPWQRCSYWPVRAPERYQGPFNRTFANKVLIIGNAVRTHSHSQYGHSLIAVQYDNATPFSEAAHLAAVLGDQAALVKQNGFGVNTL